MTDVEVASDNAKPAMRPVIFLRMLVPPWCAFARSFLAGFLSDRIAFLKPPLLFRPSPTDERASVNPARIYSIW
jgi:hypothetical protein